MKKWYPQDVIKRAYVKVLQQLFEINAGMRHGTPDEIKELLRKEQSGERQLYEDYEAIYRGTARMWRNVKKRCPLCGGPPHLFAWEQAAQEEVVDADEPVPF